MFRSRGGFVEAAGKPSKWQQWHTFLVLARTKESLRLWATRLSAQTWTARYEIRAIEKLRRMETDNGKPKYAITLKVEMQESNCSRESHTIPTKSETWLIINVSDSMLGSCWSIPQIGDVA